MYLEENYIEEVPPNAKAYGKYKYRVWGRGRHLPTHHTNDLEDAKKWFEKCKEYWLKLDEEEKK